MSYQLQSSALPTRVLHIDSRDADRYLSNQVDNDDGSPTGFPLTSYYQYILNEPIEIPGNQRVLISLESATIPYSFYTIRYGVNDLIPLKMVDDDTDAFGKVNFVITPGNYTVYTLNDYLATEIPKATKDADTNWTNLYKDNFKLTISFDPDTAKNTFQIEPTDTAKNWSLYFDFDSEVLDVQEEYANVETGWRLGSHRIRYQASADPKLTTISQNVVDINGSIHGIYIRTNLVSTGTLDSQTGTFSNILSRVPINVASGGIIFSIPANNISRSMVDLRSINSLTIRLTDERNRTLDLNGLHFQLAILCEFVYAEKPQEVPKGALSEDGGHSYHYSVDGEDMENRIALYQKERAEQLEKQKEKERERRRRGPGRPRSVGRPREHNRPVGRPPKK